MRWTRRHFEYAISEKGWKPYYAGQTTHGITRRKFVVVGFTLDGHTLVRQYHCSERVLNELRSLAGVVVTEGESEREQREHGWKPCVRSHFNALDHCGWRGLSSFYYNCRDDTERQKCQRAVMLNASIGRWP